MTKNGLFCIFCCKDAVFLYSINIDFLIWIRIRVSLKLECVFLILLDAEEASRKTTEIHQLLGGLAIVNAADNQMNLILRCFLQNNNLSWIDRHCSTREETEWCSVYCRAIGCYKTKLGITETRFYSGKEDRDLDVERGL